ncbi:MAG: hypothetical protein Sapg2KO_32950 [Saprospiraceae bacterium]
MKRLWSLSLVFILLVQISSAQTTEEESIKIDLYGFVRLNTTVDFQDMGNSDLFRPAIIPMEGRYKDSPHLYMSAKQSRFGIKAERNLNGQPLKARIEVDFHNNADQAGGLVRLRHAYFSYAGFTFGQAWSTFYDIQARPKIVDFEGANSATLNRVPLLRYDHPIAQHTWSLALENPIEQITVSGPVEIHKQILPDLVTAFKFRWNDQQNFIKVAALARQLQYETPLDHQSDVMQTANLWGGGLMVSSSIQVAEADHLKFQMIGGKGIARYIRGVRNLGYDAICKADCNELESIGVYGGFTAYEHQWTDQWSSTFLLGGINIVEATLFEADDLDYCLYGSANIFYEPAPAFSIGLEYLYGEKINLTGFKAGASRVQTMAMMRF